MALPLSKRTPDPSFVAPSGNQQARLRGAVIYHRELVNDRQPFQGKPVSPTRELIQEPSADNPLRSFVRREAEIEEAGIREVVVFHSTAEELLRYEADLPFTVIPDPRKELYAAFGVEAAPRALLDPRAWLPTVRGVLSSGLRVFLRRQALPPLDPTTP